MYDITIVGGGIMGASLTWSHIALTNTKSVLLIEKNEDLAMVNSHPLANAETLHDGATETNMALHYARRMRYAARLMATFLEKYAPEAFRKVRKMVIGVGADEIKLLEERYREFKPYYPSLVFLRGKEITTYEPKIMDGRKNPDEVVAILERIAYSVDYQKVAIAFVEEAKKEANSYGKVLDLKFNIKVKDIKDLGDHFELITEKETVKTKVVIFASGPYSLLFAHKLGIAKEYALFPVAGDFYTARHLVDGKVYTVQPKSIPVARVHADPAVYDPLETRIGPTAIIVPFLERYHFLTFVDFIRTGLLSVAGLKTLVSALLKPEFRKFEILNILYKIPFFGKWFFLKYAAGHLFPALRYRDLKRSKRAGGIRPQLLRIKEEMVNGELKKPGLEMGIGEFFGKKSAFIVTPSPGASKALDTAIETAKWTVKELGAGYAFDKKRFQNEFQLFEIGKG